MSTTPYQPDERGLVLACPQCGRSNRLGYERLGREFQCGQCKSALPAPDVPVEIASEGAFSAMIARSALPVLVDFWAPWCGPCKMVAPELVKVARMGAKRWVVAKVNTEELPGVAGQFGIRSIPTLVLFRQGREIARQAGAMPAPAIVQFVERFEN